MTVVALTALHSELGVPEPIAHCTVTVTYWAGRGPFVNVTGAEVTFPTPISIDVVDGAPDQNIDLIPTGGVCCVRWVFKYGARTFTRYTSIPETGPVDFGNLPVVDPSTFDALEPSATQLETIQTLLLDGLTLQRVTQDEYDNIPTPRPTDVLYVITH